VIARSQDRELMDEPIALEAIEAAVLGSNEIEEWHREILLAQVRSLEDFYLTRARRPAASVQRP